MIVKDIDLKVLFTDIGYAVNALSIEASTATDEVREKRLTFILRTLRADEELLIKYIEQL